VRILRRRATTFEIRVEDLRLLVTAPEDVAEEVRAAALSLWEQLRSYSLRDPAFRTSKRPITAVRSDAPDVVREMVAAASAAGVGPMVTFRGAVVDQVGRVLAAQLPELTVACAGDYFIKARRRTQVGIRRADGDSIAVAFGASEGVGVSTTLGRARAGAGPDGLAVIASSCTMADAVAAGVQAILTKPGGFAKALRYLRAMPGVLGGVIVVGEHIGLAGGVEIAA
jgi:ApbE superfamily uncharacterized protein (UPF0280 family)